MSTDPDPAGNQPAPRASRRLTGALVASSRVEMPLGAVLYESGTALTHVYFPTTAIASLFYTMENGASVEIAIVGNEGLSVFRFFMGGQSTTNRAVVQSGGHAYRQRAPVLMNEFNCSAPP
jgi:hypothetical protein